MTASPIVPVLQGISQTKPEVLRAKGGKNVTTVAENIAAISQKIRGFEQQYGRPVDSVRLLAVSKRQSVEKIREAAAAGVKDFGENYLQEALDKIETLADQELIWHYIGPIQTNKTRGIAQSFNWVHSVDREKVARRLSEQRNPSLDDLNVCVQVNLSEEASKSGTELESAEQLCQYVDSLPNLRLRGLMAIPAPISDFQAQRYCFRRLAERFEALKARFPTADTLSLGMSSDYEAAIAEGSTMVRLGTVIFGARS